MAARKKNRIDPLHPVVTFTAAGLLIGGTFAHMVGFAPGAPRPASPPVAAAERPVTMASASAGLAGPPAPTPSADPAAPSQEKTATPPASPLPRLPSMPPQAMVGPPAPVHRPEWHRAPLPAVSREVLQAMLNPRAVRRARRLRRLGLIPPDPAPASPLAPAAPHPHATAPPPAISRAPRTAVSAASGSDPRPQPAPHEAVPAELSGPAAIARLDQPRPDRLAPDPAASASAGKAAEPQPGTNEKPAGGSSPREAAPEADAGTQRSGTGPGAPTAEPLPPIRLQARLDHPRAEYRVGEWVGVRFVASQPVHLRVYRVDAAGHVTRVFSTYSREDHSSPTRAFSLMVKAGEPRPGPEGMVAIGSARPLTRDELLTCLRAYLSETPTTAAPVPSTQIQNPKSKIQNPDALQAVIDAVASATDTPDAAPAPLDRASWSIAVGRFVSADPKLSAANGPAAEPASSAGS